MDRDRERFARLAERAKQPPFTPLENLLERGRPELLESSLSLGCTCDQCALASRTDSRVVDALAKLRARKHVELGRTAEAGASTLNVVLPSWEVWLYENNWN